MTASSEKYNFFVPSFIKRTLGGLLLPGQEIEEIFDEIGGLLSEGSDEIRPDTTVWGSEVMTLNKKKPKTLDMFFDKIIKTEPSELDSNCSVSSNDDTAIEYSSKINKIKSSPDSATQKSEKGSKRISKKNVAVISPNKLNTDISKSKSRKHSISSSSGDESTGTNVKNSPSYSVDLFSEDIQNSNNHQNKTNTEYSSSGDEIIPSSQVHQSSSRLSLGSIAKKSLSTTLSKSSGGMKNSEVAKEAVSKKSNTQNTLENEQSSEEDEPNEQPILSKLDSIKNNMKNLKEIFAEIETNSEKFSFGDLTEDDELYILQCPSEIDCQKLKGVELTLEGNSVISIDDESKYDCFSIRDSQRHLYVALPDTNEQEMKLGVFRLAGNIILSENLDIPFTKPIKDNAQSSVSLEISNRSQTEESPGQHGLKKKKKHRNTNDTSLDETVRCERFSEDFVNVSSELVSKKKKRKHTNLESIDTDSENVSIVKKEFEDSQIILDTQETPTKTKKMKRKSKEEDKSSNTSFSEFETPTSKPRCEDSHIIPDSEDQETPMKTKKKKSKIKEEDKSSNASFLEFEDPTSKTLGEDSRIIPESQDQETPLKAKKKKRNSNEEDFGTPSKTVGEVSQIIAESQEDQETPLKKKKKKRKSKEEDKNSNASFSEFEASILKTECEDSQIITDSQDQETPLKVKKKKRKSKEGTTHDETNDSEYFSSDHVRDVLNKLVSKKKKRKHYSLGSNESADNQSNFDNFLSIKTEWEEPQVMPVSQVTPSKKRSRKDTEDSEEFSQEVPKKKKKKKHSYSESEDI